MLSAIRRLIPTHAGKTSSPGSATSQPRAHPHSRGENRLPAEPGGQPPGSSRLTRGKRENHPIRPASHRLIPTHAGKTRIDLASRAGYRAHPHSRGENAIRAGCAVGVWGSSPLTRGKHYGHNVPTRGPGLIPTHAGKTSSPPAPGAAGRAHPHSRGENPTLCWASGEVSGSSPLTRGKPHTVLGVGRSFGLIPTHAGKTEVTDRAAHSWRAHPHSRGENAIRLGWLVGWRGSSPLTRGKPWARPGRSCGWGLIPTHAGKTYAAALARTWVAAHPHSRGENIARARAIAQANGSSPLTRGKRP